MVFKSSRTVMGVRGILQIPPWPDTHSLTRTYAQTEREGERVREPKHSGWLQATLALALALSSLFRQKKKKKKERQSHISNFHHCSAAHTEPNQTTWSWPLFKRQTPDICVFVCVAAITVVWKRLHDTVLQTTSPRCFRNEVLQNAVLLLHFVGVH